MAKDIYYVYEWYNIDTGEVFYVGKGKDYRYKNISHRNILFKNYYNTHNCNVRIIFNNLSEEDAFKKEIETIKYYKENTNYKLTNRTNGGEGSSGLIVSDEFREKMKQLVMGEKNPNYGHKWTEEMKQNLREKMKNRYDGENNPNYGHKWSREQRANNNTSKKVICDGIEFITLKECSEFYNINYSTMQGWINHKCRMPKEFEQKGLRWKDE